jgi:hypothetical protein
VDRAAALPVAAIKPIAPGRTALGVEAIQREHTSILGQLVAISLRSKRDDYGSY